MCSGTLLNDGTPGTQVPYLYTANHCLDEEAPLPQDRAVGTAAYKTFKR